MQEIAVFVRELGVPIASTVALAVVLYKIGTVCGKLLIDAWKSKDTRLGELEQKVERINNGQRAALEQRLDVSIEQANLNTQALDRVGECLNHLGTAFAHFAQHRPCLHPSDIAIVQQKTSSDVTPSPDDKTLATIARRQERKEKREG